MIYISIFFFILSSICNSVMDILTHHYERSVFKGKDRQYWDPTISWKNKYVDWDSGLTQRKKIFGINKHVSLTDGWHLFKSLMIIFLVTSIITISNTNINLLYSIGLFILYGIVWNLTFNLFYHKILRS